MPTWARRGSLLAIAGALVGLVGGLFIGAGVSGGETKTEFVTGSCQAGTPGCELRTGAHYHADFAVFIKGEKLDFTDDFYIAEKGNEERSENVHIHEPYTDVVHVHKTGTTWDEFFRTIGMKLFDPSSLPGTTADQATLELRDGTVLRQQDGNTFKFYMNGVRVDGIANLLITDLSRLLISYGSETPEQVETLQLPQVKDEACIASENCIARVDPNAPKEACTGRDGSTCN